MRVEIISNNETMGTVTCNSMSEAKLFLAKNFPDSYFGANLIGTTDDGQRIFELIAVKEAYGNMTPMEAAIESIDISVKHSSGLCDVFEDYDGTSYTAYENIKSINNEFVKG